MRRKFEQIIIKFKKLKINYWLSARILLILVLPGIAYLLVFEPFHSVQLPRARTIKISPPLLYSRPNQIKHIIAEMIEMPLALGFRDLCIINSGFLFINEKGVTKQDAELSGAGIAEIQLFIANSTSTFRVKPQEKRCITINKKEEEISYNLSPVQGIVKPEDTILRKYFNPNPDLSKPEYSIEINFDNVKFLYRTSPIYNWVKLFIFFIFWNSILLLTIELYKFLKVGYKKP